MLHGILVDAVPVVATEVVTIGQRTDKQEQRALRHVEVGDHGIDQAILEARGNEYLCGRDEGVLTGAVEVGKDGTERIECGQGVLGVVGFPLMHDEVLSGDSRE